MTTSRIPAVIDALVSTLTTALSGTATVYDGQWVTAPSGTESFVTVGWTPDNDGPSASQEFVGASTTAKNEHIDIPCYADAYTGDTGTASRRNAAFALLTAVENALRPDVTLGGAIPQPGWAELGSYTLRQEQTDTGLDVGVVFHVNVITRI